MKRTQQSIFYLLAIASLIDCAVDNWHTASLKPRVDVTTGDISNITGSSAQSGGSIRTQAGASVSDKGLVWDSKGLPTISLSTKISYGPGGGTFSTAITGLNFNTRYYVRAYAISSLGTIYGSDVTFPTLADPAGVYVCGTDGSRTNVAAYWKNGSVQDLVADKSTTSGANAIAISESGDVYIVGSIGGSIKYWKNSIVYSVTDGVHLADAQAIAISGSDIYIGGYEYNSNQKPVVKIWKNGVSGAMLNDGTTMANINQLVVANGEVHAVGYDQVGFRGATFDSTHKARYWRNEAGIDLAISGDANSIFVDGSDVYIAGSISNGHGGSIATLWKNGIAIALSDSTSDAYASSVFVAKGNVHILGYERAGVDNRIVKYWKNLNLSVVDQGYRFNPISVAGKNDDVYILYNNNFGPVLLKNGVKVGPFDGTSSTIYARGLLVK